MTRRDPPTLADLAADARELRRAAERVEREVEIARAGGDGAYSELLAARSALATARQAALALDAGLAEAARERRPTLVRRAAEGDQRAVAWLRRQGDLAGLLAASIMMKRGGTPEGSA